MATSIGVAQLTAVCAHVRHIDCLLRQPQRFGAVRDKLARLPCAAARGFDPMQANRRIIIGST
jgi:hypothetical protein